MMAATTPRKKKPKPALDHLLAQAQRPERSIPVCLRSDLQAEFEALERELREARVERRGMMVGGDGADIAARMQAVREEMTDAVVQFRLRAVSPKGFRKLQAAHPSANPKELFDVDSFGPALLRASTVEPDLSDAQWEHLIGDDGVLSSGQYDTLVEGAWSLNKQDAAVPFSQLASTVTRSSAGK